MSSLYSGRALLGVAISVSILAVGCSKSHSNQPGGNGQPQSAPAWTLTLKSSCNSAAQDQCLSRYGFSVGADGKYQVGPGPQGQLRKGVLSDAEFSGLKHQIEVVIGSNSPWGTENHSGGVENESDDSLVLLRPGSTDRVIAHNVQGDFYYTTTSVDEAKSLHAAIRDLANSYYRLPFGDACGDAADKVLTAAEDITQCQSDSDCVYIDAYHGFEVVPPSSVEWLLTEDCTAIKPPVVANKFSVAGASQKLEDLVAAARSTCGQEFSQSAFGRECYYDQKATSTQPSCVQNHCRSRL